MAYKKDVDDPRESPSFVLLEMLLARGAIVTYNDPHIPKLPEMRHHDVPDMSSTELTPKFLAAQDCVVIATDHSAYDYETIVKHAPLILDTAQRNEKRKEVPAKDPQSVSTLITMSNTAPGDVRNVPSADVIIVGAGVAGLTAVRNSSNGTSPASFSRDATGWADAL